MSYFVINVDRAGHGKIIAAHMSGAEAHAGAVASRGDCVMTHDQLSFAVGGSYSDHQSDGDLALHAPARLIGRAVVHDKETDRLEVRRVEEFCSGGCDRLSRAHNDGASDATSDLCGVCHDAEVRLGRAG